MNDYKNWMDVGIVPPKLFKYYTFYVKRLAWYDIFEVVLGYYDGKSVYRFYSKKIGERYPYKPIAYKESDVQQYLEPFE